MLKRCSALFLMIALLLGCVCPAQAMSLSNEERYEAALENLHWYFDGDDRVALTDIVAQFDALGRYKKSAAFSYYTAVLRDTEAGSYKLLSVYVIALHQDEDFCALLEAEGLPSVDELENYAMGRTAESEGNYTAAIAYYEKSNGILDSMKRFIQLAMTAEAATPTPSPTKAPTAKPVNPATKPASTPTATVNSYKAYTNTRIEALQTKEASLKKNIDDLTAAIATAQTDLEAISITQAKQHVDLAILDAMRAELEAILSIIGPNNDVATELSNVQAQCSDIQSSIYHNEKIAAGICSQRDSNLAALNDTKVLLGIIRDTLEEAEFYAHSFADDYEFVRFDLRTCEISGYAGRDTKLSIPSELNGYRVTAIGDSAFFGCNFLTSVSIPSSVTEIGRGAFLDCSSLTSISISSSVNSIGSLAFYNCPNLTLRVKKNSYAHQYAIDNKIPYTTY